MPLPRIGIFLRIAPASLERQFWHQEHLLSSFFDWWSPCFTIIQHTMVLRFLMKYQDIVLDSRFQATSSACFLALMFGQLGWRLLAPSQYDSWRSCTLIFNRVIRFMRFVQTLYAAKSSMSNSAAWAATRLGLFKRGPVRAVLLASRVMACFAQGCNFVLPFRLQLAFHVALTLVHNFIYAPWAMQILSGSPTALALQPPRAHVPGLCPVPALPPPQTCSGGPACSPHHPQVQGLCMAVNAVRELVLSVMVPFHLLKLPDPCQAAPAAVLVLFCSLLMGLFIPVFVAYRLEHHAKCMYVRAVLATQQPPEPAPGSGSYVTDADDGRLEWDDAYEATLHSLPHWTDIIILAVLGLVAWEAAILFNAAAAYWHFR